MNHLQVRVQGDAEGMTEMNHHQVHVQDDMIETHIPHHGKQMKSATNDPLIAEGFADVQGVHTVLQKWW